MPCATLHSFYYLELLTFKYSLLYIFVQCSASQWKITEVVQVTISITWIVAFICPPCGTGLPSVMCDNNLSMNALKQKLKRILSDAKDHPETPWRFWRVWRLVQVLELYYLLIYEFSPTDAWVRVGCNFCHRWPAWLALMGLYLLWRLVSVFICVICIVCLLYK